ncbi:MAG: DUF4058 family protein [Oscillochloridaceae bacterium]|nr:DUF4058 family protein [Chloroflexaceae bacterium]MDW8391908.1 DUF4058 family protein [Oscillochloridaceae bacterium]
MPSPFPGMAPYLEGYLWPDVHNALAAKIRQVLTPLLRPRYTARLSAYVVEDTAPESDLGVMYPDVEVKRARRPAETIATATEPPHHEARTTTPAAVTIPMLLPVEVQIPNVEIRDTAHNQLVTSIEIISPVNKREPGLSAYRRKRQRLYQAGVHLLELDLLRRGIHPIAHAMLPEAPYLIALTRAHTGSTDVWPLRLPDPLPVVPVPLLPPDDDVVLDLGLALREVYDEAAYDLSIDYQQDPPPPPLSAEERSWLNQLRQRM